MSFYTELDAWLRDRLSGGYGSRPRAKVVGIPGELWID